VFWLQRIPLPLMWIPVNVLFFGMVLAQALPPITWQTADPLQRLLTRAMPVVVGVCTAGVYLVQFSSTSFTRAELNQLNRLLLLVFAVFSLAVVIWQIVANTRAKEQAVRHALDAARRAAEMQLALSQAEQDYQEVLSVASRHRTRLATVSHDLKQPVAALRMAVDQLQRHGRESGAGKLARAIDYISSLAHSYIEAGTADESATVADPDVTLPGGRETVECSVFARALQQMFAGQATQQGIRLRVHCPPGSIVVDPLATMRIMTNLVSNALTHAAPTKLLIGFRSRGDSIVFQVHDNGCGMDEATLAAVRQPGIRNSSATGHGLGLGIVAELCAAQDMTFRLESTPGHGTSAGVTLSRA
jgi:signal transduction histidine kinase